MTPEMWKPIPGFSRYDASSEGRIRSWCVRGGKRPGRVSQAPTIKAQGTNSRGYRFVNLTGDDGRPKTLTVHRLVLLAFLGQPDVVGWTASHMNGNPADNRVSNLAWESLDRNHARQHPHGTAGRRARGEAASKAKLTEAGVRAIRATHVPGARDHRGPTALARRYGVGKHAIHKIVTRRTWRHVEDEGASEASGNMKDT